MLRGSWTRDRANRPTGFVPYAGFVTPLGDGRRIPIDLFVSDPCVDRYDRDQYEFGYSFDARLGGGVRFVSNGRYARIDLVYAGLFGQFTGNPVLSGGRYYLNRGNSRQDAFLDNVTVDSHLAGTVRTGPLAHELLGGADYSFSRTASATAMGAAPRLDIFAPQYDVAIPALGGATTTRQKLDQVGLYVQDRIKAGGFVALLSARRDWVGVTTQGAAGAVARGAPERTTYRAGLLYPTPIGLAPFVSYAQSFTPVIGVEAATGRYYRPETGRSWEAGLKLQPRGVPLLATASLFTIDRDGVLVANPVAGFPTNQSQLGLQRSRGGEVEVQARPTRTLNLTGALTAFRIRNRRGLAAAVGKAPTATPAFTASAFADYTSPDGSPFAGLGLGDRHSPCRAQLRRCGEHAGRARGDRGRRGAALSIRPVPRRRERLQPVQPPLCRRLPVGGDLLRRQPAPGDVQPRLSLVKDPTMTDMLDRRALLALSALASAGAALPAAAQTGERPARDPMAIAPDAPKVAMLVYPRMVALDLIGPMTVFNIMRWNVQLVWKDRAPVATDVGVPFAATQSFAQCAGDLDVLFVPGGVMGTVACMNDPEVCGFLADRGARAKWVTSVCTGSLALGAAGLLKGYDATAHWAVADLLPLMGARHVDKRVVRDRNRMTAGGVTAGIDFGLALAAAIAGEEAARRVQLMIEYAPAPPFRNGTPAEAGAERVAAMRKGRTWMDAQARQAAEAAGKRLRVA